MDPRRRIARKKRIHRRLYRCGWRWRGKVFRRWPFTIRIDPRELAAYVATIWDSVDKHSSIWSTMKRRGKIS